MSFEKKAIFTCSYLSLLIYALFYYLKTNYGFFEQYFIFFIDELDRYADFLKIIFSFNFIFTSEDLINLKVPEIWIYYNPYGIREGVSQTLVMTLPPLSIILIVFSAYIVKLIGFHYTFFYAVLIFALFAVFFKLFFNKILENKYLLLVLFSFPTLFLIDRGNLFAAVAGLCIFFITRNFLEDKGISNTMLLCFIIACSIRPNYLIFGLMFLYHKDYKINIKNFIKISSTYLFLNFIFLQLASLLLPNYNFSNFITMLREYEDSGIFFNPWNSSLQGALYNIYRYLFELQIYSENTDFWNFIDRVVNSPKLIYLIISIFGLFLVHIYIKSMQQRISKISVAVSLFCITAITSTPFADYHLIIFVFLFFLLVDFKYQMNLKNYNITILLVLLILLPKLHAFAPNLNFSNLFNLLLLLLLFSIHYFSKISKFK